MATTKEKKRGILGRIIGGVGSKLAETKIRKSQMTGELADVKAVNMFMGNIPRHIPGKVRQDAKSAIEGYVKAGNYAAARKYIQGLKN